MNKEQMEGRVKKATGAVKEAAGKATDNPKLQGQGIAEKAAGAGKKALGDAKARIHKATR